MKFFHLIVIITVFFSCTKDKTPIIETSELNIPEHAPDSFELIASVPVSPYSVDRIRFSSSGEMIWSLSSIWRSSDLGKTWQQVNNPASAKSATIVSNSTFLCGWWNMYRTTDNGNTFTQLSPGLGITYALEHVSGNVVVAAVGNKIKKSDDLGDTWYDVYNQEEDSMGIEEITFVDETTGFAIGATDVNSTTGILMLKTTNGGASWKPTLTYMGWDCYNASFVNAQVAYALLMNDIYEAKLMKTTNGGLDWLEIPLSPLIGELTNAPGSICFFNETEGYVAHNNTIYLTRNGGLSWEPIFSWTNKNLLQMTVNNGKVFLAFENGEVYRSK